MGSSGAAPSVVTKALFIIGKDHNGIIPTKQDYDLDLTWHRLLNSPKMVCSNLYPKAWSVFRTGRLTQVLKIQKHVMTHNELMITVKVGFRRGQTIGSMLGRVNRSTQ